MIRTLSSAIRGASERARRRRDYATLLDYDDRMLDDIGIRRERHPQAVRIAWFLHLSPDRSESFRHK